MYGAVNDNRILPFGAASIPKLITKSICSTIRWSQQPPRSTARESRPARKSFFFKTGSL